MAAMQPGSLPLQPRGRGNKRDSIIAAVVRRIRAYLGRRAKKQQRRRSAKSRSINVCVMFLCSSVSKSGANPQNLVRDCCGSVDPARIGTGMGLRTGTGSAGSSGVTSPPYTPANTRRSGRNTKSKPRACPGPLAACAIWGASSRSPPALSPARSPEPRR